MYNNGTNLMLGITARKPEAWKQLYARYYVALCRYAVKRVGDPEIAADIVQNTMIRLWENPPSFENEAILRFYVYRSVHNNCLQYIRNKNREDKRLREWCFCSDEPESEFWSAVVFEETVRKLQALIRKLPDRRREVILLSMKKMSNEEIAQKLGITVHAVKKAKKEAYAYFRQVWGTGALYFLFFFSKNRCFQ